MRFTSKLGNFDFDDSTPLSLAKLVRDTVTAQWFNPSPGSQRLKNEDDCYQMIRGHSSQILADVGFDLEILVPKPKNRSSEAAYARVGEGLQRMNEDFSTFREAVIFATNEIRKGLGFAELLFKS